MSALSDFQTYVTELESSAAYKTWCANNPSDCSAWQTFSAAILAGQAPTPPSVNTPFGKALAQSGVIAMEAIGVSPAPPPPPPPPPPSGLIFSDEFAGSAGAPPDPSKWVAMDGVKAPFGDTALAANCFLDGSGHLVVRTKRQSGGGYSGGFLSTFKYGSGWPPANIKAALPVPFQIDVRMKMPDTAGAHSSMWMMNVDRSQSQDNYELDIAEERTTLDTVYGCHQHTWVGGSDKAPADGALKPISSMRTNWHVYTGKVYADRVECYCDGALAHTFYGVSGNFGVILSNGIAPSGTWGAAGGQPAPNDPGPWDMLVDYVHVYALA